MKKLFCLITAATLLIGCSAEDAEPVIQSIIPEYQEYKVLDTNINILKIFIVRKGDTIQDPSYMQENIRIIPVLDGDEVNITSNGEVTTPEKPKLWMKLDGDGQLVDPVAFGDTEDGVIVGFGKEMIWTDTIGKWW